LGLIVHVGDTETGKIPISPVSYLSLVLKGRREEISPFKVIEQT